MLFAYSVKIIKLFCNYTSLQQSVGLDKVDQPVNSFFLNRCKCQSTMVAHYSTFEVLTLSIQFRITFSV